MELQSPYPRFEPARSITFDRSLLALGVLLALLLVETFNGALRFYADQAGLSAIVYLPKVACVIAVAWELMTRPQQRGLWLLLILAAASLLLGRLHGAEFKSGFFAVFIYAPLLFGLLCGNYLEMHRKAVAWIIAFCFLASLAGIALDLLISVPWKGYSYSMGGVEISGNRAWSAYGLDRIAGFSRMSSSLAMMLVIFSLYLGSFRLPTLLRGLIYLTALVGIVLTTNKSSAGAFVIALLVMSISRQRLLFLFAALAVVLGALALPLYGVFGHVDPYLASSTGDNLMGSMVDRLVNTWPNLIKVMDYNGWIYSGAGLGMTGSAYAAFPIFGVEQLAVADNSLLYLWCLFGVMGIGLYLLAVPMLMRLQFQRGPEARALLGIAFCVLLIGWTSDVLESQVPSLFLGLAIGRALRLPGEPAPQPAPRTLRLQGGLLSLLACALLVGSLLQAPRAMAKEAPVENLGPAEFIVGASTHQNIRSGNRDGINRLAREAGIVSFRDDAYWSSVERERGKLSIDAAWRAQLRSTRSLGISTLLILGNENQFYGNAKPRDDASREGYLRYVRYLVRSFKGQVAFYEVWNEWDVENPTDKDFSDDYLSLVRATAKVIREEDPQAKVLAGAVTLKGIRQGFAERLAAGGVLDVADGISLHPSVYCEGEMSTPEAWLNWFQGVNQKLQNAAGKPVPLYFTEFSWPAHEGDCGISRERQAAYLARAYVLVRSLPNVKGAWWYDLVDDGIDRREMEHNFGLLTASGQPKPAYHAMASIADIIGRYRFVGREQNPDPNVYLLRFAKAGEEILVAWTLGHEQTLNITSKPGSSDTLWRLDVVEGIARREGRPVPWNCPQDGGECQASIRIDASPTLVRSASAAQLTLR
ncbi:hypothetical protein QO207_08165 [Pseudomonas sp. CAN2814]|uniref:GH39 family glycosyl hydrolase n=1 Tax=Pseudomonas sp. CAN1 TaxID=3046726 RepID=UPI002649EF74|nr:hypothetical protein [Pseudomonas sp. CAN1]MDN6856560.1 hypothetical protein [Pseudomonas sp. CAN1]